MDLLETRSGGGSEKEDGEERKGTWEEWVTVIGTNLWKAHFRADFRSWFSLDI